jgi:perosamine synthetase
MVQILKEHGLVPVPLDLNIDTMEPISFEAIKPLVSEKTKCVILAYLYGIRFDSKPYIEYFKDKNIDIIEDVAQSFNGAQYYNGTPGAKLTLFSLGLIKVQTSFYGAVAVIRDEPKLYETMRDIQETYPLFGKSLFLKRLLTATAVISLMNYKSGPTMLDMYVEFTKKEREEFYISMVRGFKPASNYLNKFRLNPCAALLSFISYRMQTFDVE